MVWPVEEFLAHLEASGKAPNTVEAYARDLRDLFEWLGQRGWDFRELSLEQLAEFLGWLRRPREIRRPGVLVLPGAPSAVASFYRFHARRDERVPALLGELDGPRPTEERVKLSALAHFRWRCGGSPAEPGFGVVMIVCD